MKKSLNMPAGASRILDMLHEAGFAAYLVGGCLRDSLMGKAPKDWDITTSATPAEVEATFNRYQILETGIEFGTVTILLEDGEYEITTFRTDGTYSDNRKPDSVQFVRDIREDLSRRDLTINAIAYDGNEIVDPFHGEEDLLAGRIVCVGDANKRFQEDALRILRALRFASVYGFEIEAATAEAIHSNRALLNNVSGDRIAKELFRILCGKGALEILLDYRDVITTVIPELGETVGFEQRNRYHVYDVYEHIAHSVAECASSDPAVRMAMLLHDAGKPATFSLDENGNGHFFGHAEVSRGIAEKVVARLHLDNATKAAVTELVALHDTELSPSEKSVKKVLNRIREQRFHQLLAVQYADTAAQSEYAQAEKMGRLHAVEETLGKVLAEGQCYTLKSLAIGGREVMSLGVPQSKTVGKILQSLLEAVMSGTVSNSKEALLKAAAAML